MKNLSKLDIIKFVLAFIFVAVFISILILVSNGHAFYIDRFNNFVAEHRNNFFNGFFKYFTFIGSFWGLAIICAVLFFVVKQKHIATFSALSLCFAGILNYVIKIIIKRPRPDLMIIAENGYSFPSGHAMMSLALFGILIYFVCCYIKNKPLKIFVSFALASLTLLIGFSRIYLGVHYLSDVLAGFSLATAIVVGFVFVNKLWVNNKHGKIN